MYTLSSWVLVLLALFWLVDLFVLERRQLQQALAADSGPEGAPVRPWWRLPSQWLGLPFAVLVIWSAIQESRDLALLLILATLYAGLVVLLNRVLLRPLKRRIAAAAAAETNVPGLLSDSTVVDYARSFFPVLAIVVVLRSFLYEPYQIPSESMRPTLVVGDFLLVNKFTHGLRVPVLKTEFLDLGDPEPGDVIVFTPPHQQVQNYIKRVIAVGGDRVRYDYRTKQLWVNGEPVERERVGQFREGRQLVTEYREQLGDQTYRVYYTENSPRPDWPPFDAVVPEGHYFVMGDNRDNSLDSRFWEQQYGSSPFASDDALQGKAVWRWLYWPSLFSLPNFSRFGGID